MWVETVPGNKILLKYEHFVLDDRQDYIKANKCFLTIELPWDLIFTANIWIYLYSNHIFDYEISLRYTKTRKFK